MAEKPQKFPEVQVLLQKLKEERQEIEAKTLPLRAERDRLLASIQPTLAKIKALEEKYISIERPRLGEIDNQISALVRVTGGRRMSDGPTTTSTGA
jgi:uncharacterized coiled-coil DUF342 family protein